MISRVISGGQCGTDQAALRAAKAAGIPTGGTAAKGWMTEAGPAPWLAGFGLTECEADGYPARTRANVAAADAVVWFGDPHSPGGKLTLGCCKRENVDSFIVLAGGEPVVAVTWLRSIIAEHLSFGIVLMVAGNRESKSPGIGAKVEAFMADVFRLLATS